MPIEFKGLPPSLSALQSTVETAPQGHHQTTAPSASMNQQRDSVTFTETAMTLQHLERIVQRAPAVDMDKVNQTQRALANGLFQLNEHSVASKLIRFEITVHP